MTFDHMKFFISIFTTVSLALLGWFYKYRKDLEISRLKSKLERVNDQLRYLYGPLYALSRTEKRSWETFRQQCKPGGAFWGTSIPPTPEEAEAWRYYVSEVDLPRYQQIEKAILEHSDLLEGDEFPQILIELSAHISGYKPVVERWENGDFSHHTSYFNYPGEALLEYAAGHYCSLREKQRELLGAINRKNRLI